MTNQAIQQSNNAGHSDSHSALPVSFLRDYPLFFSAQRQLPVRLLAIGAQLSEVMREWAAYYSQAQLMLGCDGAPGAAVVDYDNPAVKLVVGDACEAAVRQKILQCSDVFDIVIASGDTTNDGASLFSLYFCHVAAGGLFVVTGGSDSHLPNMMHVYFRRLAAAQRLNVQQDDEVDATLLAQVQSVEFIEGICVVRKVTSKCLPDVEYSALSNSLGGTEDLPLALLAACQHAATAVQVAAAARNTGTLAQQATKWQQQLAHLQMLILQTAQNDRSTQRLLAERNNRVAGLHHRLERMESQLAELRTLEQLGNTLVAQQRRELTQRDATIAALYASTSWRVTVPLRLLATQVYRLRRIAGVLGSALRIGGGPAQTAQRAMRLYRKEGWAGVRRGLRIAAAPGHLLAATDAHASPHNDYTEWVRRYDSLDEEGRRRIEERIDGLPRFPLISVLMPVYNAPVAWLEQAIDSVRAQLYGNWELCIADDASTQPAVRRMLEQQSQRDARIKVVYREQNGHISASSNSALALASGEFVALLDHDDMLAETALFRIAEAIIAHPDAVLFYSDEDKVDADNRRYDPYFKPDYNYELLLAQNMICHLGAYRTATLRELGGFRTGVEGAQDYDLALRVTERATVAQVVHLPYVLYHWRAIAGSTALAAGEKNYAAQAGRQAVADHLARCGVAAEVLPAPVTPDVNRVRFACPVPQPLVSILIPTRDRADLLGMCLDSLIERSTYSNYEVIIIDNGSVEEATRELFARLPQPRFKVVRDESPFNFSALNNHAARVASGQFLCLMNNDIEILTPGWLEEMVAFAARPEIGCVGARLWYPDGRLQHGGVVLGVGGIAGHAHKYLPRGQNGYFGRAILHQAYSAVTAACLLLRREVFEQVGGLDEQLAIAFNDIDFCLRVRAAGYRNVWTPYAEMIHHESASRGEEDNPEKIARFGREIAFVEARWGDQLRTDPAYNPNLTLVHEDYSLAWPPRMPLL
jgi:glycosyltransferase involved in cell wall biosynthesis/TolA-binding protein